MKINRLYGSHGKIDVPALGAVIAEISSWDLTRREDATEEQGLYKLQAYLSTVVPWMFNNPDVVHRIVVEVGRGNQYRLEEAAGARTVLDGQSLLIEGVSLCRM